MISIKIADQKDDMYIMKMMDNDIELCIGSIKIGQACELISISNCDEIYSISMCKALLNLADRKNAKEVICKNEEIFDLLVKLGFEIKNGTALLNLNGYFSTICKSNII